LGRVGEKMGGKKGKDGIGEKRLEGKRIRVGEID